MTVTKPCFVSTPQVAPIHRPLCPLSTAQTKLILTIFATAYLCWLLIIVSVETISHPSNMAKTISILSLSQNRIAARSIHDHIQPHGFVISGVLESDPFSAKDLALALKVLEPRPQAVVVGRGYSEEEADQVRRVFVEYAHDVDITGTVIKISDEVFERVGKEGIPSWVLEQLQKHLRGY
ncbi:hypothetical protein L204_103138 [Cryptococcus depauperatus]